MMDLVWVRPRWGVLACCLGLASCRAGAVGGVSDAASQADGGAGTDTKTNGAAGEATTAASFASHFVFGAYKDVTISANWNTGEISSVITGTMLPVASTPNIDYVTWSFATGECGQELWAGIPPAQLANINVPAFEKAGKHFILSTGGAAGTFSCASDAGFAAFVQRYASPMLAGVDFDIEANQSREVIDALVARVQAAQKTPGLDKLRYSFTLATFGGSGPGLGDAGGKVMDSIKKQGLTNYLINLMVMDYGSASASACTLGADGKCDMGQSAIQAARLLHDEHQVAYAQIELTPMIGVNDSPGQTFTPSDVSTVMRFAKEEGLAGVHFWSLDRDKNCAEATASPTCSGLTQPGALGFWQAFVAAK